MPEFNLPIIALGCLGGLMPDVLRVIQNRFEPTLPDYLRTVNFWLGTLLLVVIGGLAAWMFGAQSAKDALIYGFAAPQMFSELSAALTVKRPPTDRGEQEQKKSPPFSLNQWWRNSLFHRA